MWVDLIKERQQKTHSLLGRKNESHGINLSQGQWLLPENYNYLNRTRAHFKIKQIGLRNMNTVRAYITITIRFWLIIRSEPGIVICDSGLYQETLFLIFKIENLFLVAQQCCTIFFCNIIYCKYLSNMFIVKNKGIGATSMSLFGCYTFYWILHFLLV